MGPNTAVIRRDGLDKLTGRLQYLADTPAAECWWGAAVRSPVARGRIREIRFDPAINWSEFVIVDHRDIPGQNTGAFFDAEQPVLAVDSVRHVHEPILLLGHRSRQALRRGVAGITVAIDPSPAALDFRALPSHELQQVGTDNVFCQADTVKGDPTSIMASATLVVEGSYETGAQEHCCFEPQGMEASIESGVVVVRGSMQCPFYVRAALERVLGRPGSDIRIISTPVGGGFGAKEDYPSSIAAHAALLALRAERPVRLCYDRREDMAVTTKRHPALITCRTAVSRQGEIEAMQIDLLLDGGAYRTLSPIVLERAMHHATGPYRCDHVRVDGRVRMTNTVPNGAFRGFGSPQAHFGIERHMDRIAARLGLDPATVRRRNLLRDGDTLVTGRPVADGVDTDTILDRALVLADYETKHVDHHAFNRAHPWRRRGVGMATSFHGCGLPVRVEAAIRPRVEIVGVPPRGVRLLTSIVEMGQGVDTIFADLVARRLGLDPKDIELAAPDTTIVPDSGPSVASRTSMIVGRLIERACDDLLRQLEVTSPGQPTEAQVAMARWYQTTPRKLLVGRAEYDPDCDAQGGRIPEGPDYPAYGWVAQVAEVEVDLRTGLVQVIDFVSVQDVGNVLDRDLATGQVHGAVAQCIGWAVSEEVVYASGAMVNASTAAYFMPTALDLPAVQVEFVETPSAHGPRGARGLGEVPMVGGAAAVANAISQAIGLPVDGIPATPEKIMAAMDAGPS